MQTQHPALRPGDAAALNPTAGAKRWGVYPYRRAGAGIGTNPQQQQQSAGTSPGVTPTQPGFPTVRLDFPQWSDDKNSAWLEVTVEDLNAARAQHRAQVGDAAASEEAFRAYLTNLATTVYPRGTLLWDQADKLLRLLDLVADRETREEYQRLLFSGNTTNEVRN